MNAINRRQALAGFAASLLTPILRAGEFTIVDHRLTVPGEFTVVDHRPTAPAAAAPRGPAGKVIVYYWSTDECSPCARFKRERSQMPWIDFRDGRRETRGAEPESYPFFRVDVPGNPGLWYPIRGWRGVDWFAAELRSRGIARPATSRVAGYPTSFSPPEWTEASGTRPGLITHLAGGVHPGFSRDWLHSLTWRQLVAVHSDSHNGRVHWEFVNRN